MQWCLDQVGVVYRLDDGSRIAALSGVSCSIRQGERVAVIGNNGSGKSTLARLLAGIIQPTTGRITHEGEDNHDLGTAALVLQNPGDNIIGETVREEIELTVGGVDDAVTSPRRDALLSQYGLVELLDRPLAELSGGETQLVALVCGLLSGRRMVVLDEPTSHLDPPARRLLIDHLMTQSSDTHDQFESTPAVLFITQYRDEAQYFPRVIELDRGRLSFDGAPEELPVRDRDESPDDNPLPVDSESRPIVVVQGLNQSRSANGESAAVLKEITLTVQAGDAIGIVGPIGSGKTTLGYHLAGLMEPSAGTVEYRQGVSTADPPVVLIQFPERQLFAETVLDDVAFGARNRGLDRSAAAAQTRQVLDAVGLPAAEFEQRSPFSLSGGQKRRVALASVAVCGATLYILDEPTSALDADGHAALEEQLRRWRTEGVAYIVISHDVDWLRRVTERVWIIDKGRLLLDAHWPDDATGAALEQIGFVV
ncbi:MAG: ATP-binding cassette domain-containing protein [candidate division Zixibacteria bacterium]|nr:ATP-binding cassette domain-containing protein [candidate division Zixibacteria bacterium]